MRTWHNKDILVVSPAPVFPRDFGNRLRIHRICERLEEAGARVHFLLYPAEADWRRSLPLAAMRAHVDRFASFHLVPPTRPLHTGAEGSHHLKDEWWDPAIGAYLDWLIRVQRFDGAIVNYTWLSRALLHLPETCLKILDTHDRFSGRKEMFIANGLEPEFFYMQAEEEAAALSRADVVWAIKREEAEFFRAITDRPVFAVPHIDRIAELPAPAPAPFLRIGLIGANNNLNRDNFEKFLDAAVAHVRRHLTQFELVVAGSVCKVLRPRDEKFIRFLGFVERTEDFYAAVDAVVVPMRFSTGLKIKTAEALTFGKPVLALTHAFEGLNPIHAFHRLTSLPEMMVAIDRLTRDPALLRDLAVSSLVSAEASERDVATGLAQTLEAFEPLSRQTFWVVVNAEEIAAFPVLADHLRDASSFLASLFPAIGFVFAGPGRPDAELCGQLAHFGPLVILDEAPEAVDLADMPPRVVAVDRATLLRHAAGAWVTTRHGEPILASLPPGAGFAVFDALALSHASDPQASDASMIAALARLGSGHVLCTAELGFDGVAELLAAGWDFVLMPWLKSGEPAEFLGRLRDAPRLPGGMGLPAAPAAAGRALLDGRAEAVRALAALAGTGRAQRYRISGPDRPALLTEYLLRIGAEVDTGVADLPSLRHEDLDAALREDAGWSRIWILGRDLVTRLGLANPTGALSEPASATTAPDDADQSATGSFSYAAPVTASLDGPGPTLGFTRLTGPDVLTGREVHFAQMQVYRPRGVGMDAVDVQIMNAHLAGRSLNRLVLRFFFVEDRVDLAVRRNDCSQDCFLGSASAWQVDDWGPFLIYNLGDRLASAYPEGLEPTDLTVLAEALNCVERVQDLARHRLEGEILDRWNRIATAIRGCGLRGTPARDAAQATPIAAPGPEPDRVPHDPGTAGA